MKLYVIEMIHDEMVIPVGASLNKTQAAIVKEKFQTMANIPSAIKVKYHVSEYEISKDYYTDFVTNAQIKIS